MTASLSERLATQLNVLSLRFPNRQFLPDRAFGAALGEATTCSAFKRDLEGDPGLGSGNLQTLICRTPVLVLC